MHQPASPRTPILLPARASGPLLFRWSRRVIVAVGIVLLLSPSQAAYAACGSAPVFHGFTSSFEQCGPAAAAFFWMHGRGVQRNLGAANNDTGNTAAGHDSGNLQTLADFIMIDGPNGGAVNGSYLGSTDFANFGVDGCILNISETANATCSGRSDWGVLDYAIGGVDPADPNRARVAVVSVDFNQFLDAWVLDNAGAPAVDGDACGGDALSFYSAAVNCTPIPVPEITGFSALAGGASLTLGIGDVSGIPLLDDCQIAETRATNCPRNLYAGRVLVVKHGACDPSAAAAFDRRTYLFPEYLPISEPETITPNWIPFSVEDANLNGVLDAGEDGTHGGVANGVLDPFVIPGNSATSTTVFVPGVSGAADCIFFGLTLGLDDTRQSINPPDDTLFGEMVLAPVASVNTIPISAASGLPLMDQVTSLTSAKTQGKVTVIWQTSSEVTTAGFDVIGVKKGGTEVKLNSALIPAKEGTTGKGASYSVVFEGGQLKGAALIYLDLVKTDGSRLRFGPANF